MNAIKISNIKKIKAFSLVELIIAMSIIAILVGIAYPNYLNYKIRVNRIDMQAEMQRIAGQIQQYRAINQNYTGATLQHLGITAIYPNSGTAYFDLNLSATAQGWTLSAIPKADSMQQNNGALVLNNLGQNCWVEGQICQPNATTTWNKR